MSCFVAAGFTPAHLSGFFSHPSRHLRVDFRAPGVPSLPCKFSFYRNSGFAVNGTAGLVRARTPLPGWACVNLTEQLQPSELPLTIG